MVRLSSKRAHEPQGPAVDRGLGSPTCSLADHARQESRHTQPKGDEQEDGQV
jgi:hypothetical protein